MTVRRTILATMAVLAVLFGAAIEGGGEPSHGLASRGQAGEPLGPRIVSPYDGFPADDREAWFDRGTSVKCHVNATDVNATSSENAAPEEAAAPEESTGPSDVSTKRGTTARGGQALRTVSHAQYRPWWNSAQYRPWYASGLYRPWYLNGLYRHWYAQGYRPWYTSAPPLHRPWYLNPYGYGPGYAWRGWGFGPSWYRHGWYGDGWHSRGWPPPLVAPNIPWFDEAPTLGVPSLCDEYAGCYYW